MKLNTPTLKKSPLLQIIIALCLGILAGMLLHNCTSIVDWISAGGMIYIGFIKCIAIPLVLFAIVAGIISLKDIKKFGGIGIRTILYFFITSICAVMIGLIMAKLFSGFFPVFETATAEYEVQPLSLINTFVNIFPDNIIKAFADGALIQIIVFSVLFGISLLLIGKKGYPLVSLIESANSVFGKMLDIILKIAPFGVFCLVCPTIAEYGIEALGPLGILVGLIYIGYILHIVVVYSIAVRTLGGVSPLAFIKGLFPAIILAFSSASSIASVPVSIQCCDKLKVPKEISSFVIPFGATTNMDGLCIYLSFGTVFIASCYGFHLSILDLVFIMLLIVISSIGIAGVPGGAIAGFSMILMSLGLPVNGVALILPIDRICDLGCTAVNITGDASCAVVLSKYHTKSLDKREKPQN